MGTTITYRCPNGSEASGYLANVGTAKAPGVIVCARHGR